MRRDTLNPIKVKLESEELDHRRGRKMAWTCSIAMHGEFGEDWKIQAGGGGESLSFLF